MVSPDAEAFLDVPELLLGIISGQQVNSTQAALLCKLMVPCQKHAALPACCEAQGSNLTARYIAFKQLCVHAHAPVVAKAVILAGHIGRTLLCLFSIQHMNMFKSKTKVAMQKEQV